MPVRYPLRSSMALLATVALIQDPAAANAAAPAEDHGHPVLTAVASAVPFFSDNSDGALIVTGVPPAAFGLRAGEWLLSASCDGTSVGSVIPSSATARLPLSLSELRTGASLLNVTLAKGGLVWAQTSAVITLAPPKVGLAAVALDLDAGRGLFVGERGKALPFVPFGAYIYDITSDGNRAFPKQESPQGLNLVAPYISKVTNHTEEEWSSIIAFLDNCSAVGMRVHYHLNALAYQPDTPDKWSILQTEVMRVRDHPAVLGYYIADEPGGAKVDPAVLEKVYSFIKALDPHHPMTMAFCCADPSLYQSAFDIGMMDPYPIVSLSDEAVNQQRLTSMIIGAANSLAKTQKPFFIVLQCFGGGEAWQRAPTGAEMRVMAYLALIHGAVGLQYFARSPAEVFPNSPSAWNEVRRVALEIAELSPAIAGGQAGKIFTGADVSNNITWIEGASWHATTEPGDAYSVVLLANCNNTPSAFALTGLAVPSNGGSISPSLYTGVAEVINQNRNVSVVGGKLQDILMGYGTAAYRFPPTSWSGGGDVTAFNQIVNPSYEYAANTGSPDGDYLKGPGPQQQLNGASFMSDASTSVDGAHSLRLVSPTAGGSFAGGPYPSLLSNGTNYSLSVYAKAATAGVILDLRPSPSLKLPTGTITSFGLTTAWKRYEVIGTAAGNSKASVSEYTLTTAGIAWLDMLDIHQINDCPANDNRTTGFHELQLSPFDTTVPSAVALNENASGCCEAGWTSGVDFQALCEAHSSDGWFWWYPNTGPYLCCKSVASSLETRG